MGSGLNDRTSILILTDDLGGGTGNHLLSMIRHWDKRQWQVEIISRAPLTARESPEVPVRFLPRNESLNRYPFAQIRDFNRIRKSIRERPPCIVHTYFFWSIIIGRILKWEGKIRSLIENREDQGFGWGIHEYSWLRLTKSLPDRIICVSDAVKRVVLEKECVEEDRVEVIRNGIEPIIFSEKEETGIRGELGIGKDHLVVGMVANFNRPIKGVSCFLDAVPAVIKAVPDVKFLILGSGNQERFLKEKAKSAGVENFVIFPGYRPDIFRFYKIFDVSVLTSFSEGLSITLLESMIHGLPVVVTKVGGNPEVVEEGKTGFLVPPGDPKVIAEQIVKLLLDPELRRRMGREGRKRVEQHFQLVHVAKQYLDAYKGLAPHRNR